MGPDLHLLPRTDRRVRLGHAWIFSNEVDVARSPLSAYAVGELTVVRDAYRKPVGIAYVNPGALICARVLTSNTKAAINASWWTGRFRRALDLRERIYPTPHYRAVYGESDGCPGLVVDRYADVLVAQFNTAGILKMRDIIVQALVTATQARGLLLRSAASVRQIEGIDEFDESVGEVPDSALVHEGDAIFAAPLRTGQKTGYFFDQRDNRTRLGRYVAGKRVLDVYSYIGTWGIRAMKFGASHVTCVDSSPLALDVAHENAQRNAVDIHTCRGDALEVLNAYAADGQRFEVVVIDPPALVKRRKDLAAGQTLYQRLNAAAMKVLERSGVLVSSSCSHHLEPAMLQRIILAAAKQERRAAQILEKHAHPPDHPIHPAMPETEYLKAFFVRT